MTAEDRAPLGPLLAIETSSALGGVAVGIGDRLLAEVTLGVQVKHSESLLPAVEFVLERARLVPADLEGVVVGAGPGSFTGVRIAAATAKGLVHALGVPLFAYSSLAGLAALSGPILPGRAVCALLDARRTDVFAACYRFPATGGFEVLLRPMALQVEALLAEVSGLSPLFVGDGALRHASLLSAHGQVGSAHSAVPRASGLLWLARTDAAAGRVARSADWVPDYSRPPGATVPT